MASHGSSCSVSGSPTDPESSVSNSSDTSESESSDISSVTDSDVAGSAASEPEPESESSRTTSSSTVSSEGEPLIWELCCGPNSDLVKACRTAGLSARRVTLETGFDMSKKSSVKRLLQDVESACPRLVWCSPPCTVWSKIQNLNQRTHQQRVRLDKRRRQSRKLVKNCVSVMLAAVRGGAEICFEWPSSARGWNIPELVHLREKLARHGKPTVSAIFHGCRFGMTGVKGLYLKKAWKVFTTLQALESVNRLCPGGHLHEVIDGRNTAMTAFYPPRMCRAIAGVFAREL